MKAFAVPLSVIAAVFCLHAYAASSKKSTLEVAYMPTVSFPYELTQRGVRQGEVDVIISINPDGRIADWLVTACTDPAFEKMLADLLPDLELKLPALRDRTGPVRTGLSVSFEATGVVVSHAAHDSIDALLNGIQPVHRIKKMGTRRELDRAPVPQYTVAPLYPSDLQEAGGARVTLEFLIDQNGRVRMPVLHAGENILLANAATSALLDWRFEPATRNGQPVIVTARQEFVLPPK
ncbi:MAG: energy transducer TonB [Nibricoccus sp.]